VWQVQYTSCQFVELNLSLLLPSLAQVSLLKQLTQAKGINCKGCSEKGDYVRALRDYVNTQAAGQQAHA
jgi:hypothetical protein